jgi:hypothetical protein
MTELERIAFADWVRSVGVMYAAKLLSECTSSIMHAALGTAKPSTARRIKSAWLAVQKPEADKPKATEPTQQREGARLAILEPRVLSALRSAPPWGMSTTEIRHALRVRGADAITVLQRLLSAGSVELQIGARGAHLYRLPGCVVGEKQR